MKARKFSPQKLSYAKQASRLHKEGEGLSKEEYHQKVIQEYRAKKGDSYQIKIKIPLGWIGLLLGLIVFWGSVPHYVAFFLLGAWFLAYALFKK